MIDEGDRAESLVILAAEERRGRVRYSPVKMVLTGLTSSSEPKSQLPTDDEESDSGCTSSLVLPWVASDSETLLLVMGIRDPEA